mgnify:FL=1
MKPSLLTAPLIAACLYALLLAGCASVTPQSPAGSCTLNLPPDTSGEDAITAVLRAEGELVVAQRIDDLMALWGEGASISDAKHTPIDNTDDQDWLGKDAIRHRYVRTVFPGAPSQATPADLEIAFTGGDRAVVTATTHIGGEVAPAGDRWTLVQRDGCWLLQNLTYNLEPQ